MEWVVVGGAGFVGRSVCRALLDRGDRVVAVDINPPPAGIDWLQVDVLTDDFELPPGHVVLSQGSSMPRPVRPWTLILDNVLSTARLHRQLMGRPVTLLSSVEVYGATPGPLTESSATLLADVPQAWIDRALALAQSPCPPDRAVQLCRELADLEPSGRWVYALSKAAQERLVAELDAAAASVTVLRVANVVGAGQWRFVSRLVDSFHSRTPVRVTDNARSFIGVDDLARIVVELDRPGTFNVASGVLPLTEVVQLVREGTGLETSVEILPPPAVDSCGVVDASRLGLQLPPVREVVRRHIANIEADRSPMFSPALPIVIPPRPEQPDLVSERINAALWTGRVRGHRWTEELTAELGDRLGLRPDQQVLALNSGTNALRLAVAAVARPGRVAICPAFTFHATAEVLRQLGFQVRFADVDAKTWTIDPESVRSLIDDDGDEIAVVVAVDALGNPCNYDALRAVCGPVPLVADSAAALGALAQGVPVGTQADAHAFSMSFAKTVSAGGSGGAVVLPASARLDSPDNWLRSSLITEISAVVGLDSLRAVEELVERRSIVADIYASTLGDWLTPQQVREMDRHSWVHWTATVDPEVGRDRLAAALIEEGISTKPYYEDIRGSAPLPVSAVLHARALALPMSSELSTDDAERVAAAVRRAVRRAR